MDNTLPMLVSLDSTSLYNGKYPLRIGQVKIEDFPFLLNASLRQTLLVPRSTDADSLSVILTSKSQNLKTGRLVVTGLDDLEHMLYSDTIPIPGQADWNRCRKTFPLNEVAAVNLNIEVRGEEERNEQNLWLDKLEIFIDGKDIRDYSVPASDTTWKPEKSAIVPLSFANRDSFGKITDWSSKKILALGESFPGSDTFGSTAIEIMKHRIEHQYCRLVLLEIPLERALYINRYVQGDAGFVPDSIGVGFRYDLISREFLDFFDWLKTYNAGREDKVWLLGTDFNPSRLTTILDLYDYMKKADGRRPVAEWQRLCSRFFACEEEKETEMLEILARSSVSGQILGEKEMRLVNYCLETSRQLGKRSIDRLRLRDSVMGTQIEFLTGLLCPGLETVTIYTHLGHADYTSTDPFSPFNPACGRYLRNIYGRAYACVGLYAAEGNFLTYAPNRSLTIDSLAVPPANSLEAGLEKVHGDYFYLKPAGLPERMLPARFLGNTNREVQFAPLSPAARMDGLIFIRKACACRVPEELFDRPFISGEREIERYQNRFFEARQKNGSASAAKEK